METNNKKRRALILYATMSFNTQKVANWFAETFDEYNWEVKVVKIQGPASLEAESGSLHLALQTLELGESLLVKLNEAYE